MRMLGVFAIGVLALTQETAAQKIDSLVLRLAVPKEKAINMVAAAFVQAGMEVTRTTDMLIEADLGITGHRDLGTLWQRTVQATLISVDSVTVVRIVGSEVYLSKEYQPVKRKRIDNRTGGNGGKVWRKMVVAALALDSLAVPSEAITWNKP